MDTDGREALDGMGAWKRRKLSEIIASGVLPEWTESLSRGALGVGKGKGIVALIAAFASPALRLVARPVAARRIGGVVLPARS